MWPPQKRLVSYCPQGVECGTEVNQSGMNPFVFIIRYCLNYKISVKTELSREQLIEQGAGYLFFLNG